MSSLPSEAQNAAGLALNGIAVNKHVTRVGLAPGDEGYIRYDIANWGTSREIQAVYFKTGSQYAAGDWNFTLFTRHFLDPNPTTLATATVTLTPDAWQKWTLPSPTTISSDDIWLDIAPASTAEMDFVNLDYQEPLAFETSWMGFSGDVGPSNVSFPSGAYIRGGTMVLELDGVDPNASAACPDAGAVSGFAYDSFDVVQVPAGSTTWQTMSLPSPPSIWGAGINSLWMANPPTTALSIEADFSGPSAGAVHWTTVNNYGTWVGLGGPVFVPDGGGLFTVSLGATGGTFEIYRLTASLPDAGECDPIPRASWLGTGGHAEGRLDADLRMSVFQCAPQYFHYDGDGDGYGDPNVLAPSCGGPGPGYVSNGDDCDDHDLSVHPAAIEVCNGRDDDCNGLVDGADPFLEQTPCELGQGVCRGALHPAAECVDGHWAACDASDYGSSFEVQEASCDGLDNDCDGVIDGLLGGGPLCPNQQGACAGSHTRVCSSGVWATCTTDDLGSDWEPLETRCDGVDNDCDGLTDADDPDLKPVRCELQQGVCADSMKPVTLCASGQWAPCGAAEYGPSYQLEETACDGLDNDCDGLIDEGCAKPAPKGCGCSSGAGAAGALGVLALELLLRRRSKRRA